jgi:hypothetical protein
MTATSERDSGGAGGGIGGRLTVWTRTAGNDSRQTGDVGCAIPDRHSGVPDDPAVPASPARALWAAAVRPCGCPKTRVTAADLLRSHRRQPGMIRRWRCV